MAQQRMKLLKFRSEASCLFGIKLGLMQKHITSVFRFLGIA